MKDEEKKRCPFMSAQNSFVDCIESSCMAWKEENLYYQGYCKLIQR